MERTVLTIENEINATKERLKELSNELEVALRAPLIDSEGLVGKCFRKRDETYGGSEYLKVVSVAGKKRITYNTLETDCFLLLIGDIYISASCTTRDYYYIKQNYTEISEEKYEEHINYMNDILKDKLNKN